MKRTILLTMLLTVVVAAGNAWSLVTDWHETEQVKTRLIVPYETLPRSGTITIGVEQKIIEHWHVYWLNPGDAGFAPELYPDTEGAFTATNRYPVPTRYPFTGDLTSIGYEEEVIYLVDVTYDAAEGESLTLEGEWSYLVCYKECIPRNAPFSFTLPVGDEAVPAADEQKVIAAAEAKIPPSVADFEDISATTIMSVSQNALTVRIQGVKLGQSPDLFFNVSDDLEYIQVRPKQGEDLVEYNVFVNPLDLNAVPEEIELYWLATGLVRDGKPFAVGSNQTISTDSLRKEEPENKDADATTVGSAGGASGAGSAKTYTVGDWLVMLGTGLLGGLLLNIMPCVLPILSLKIFGVMKHATEGHGSVAMFGFGTTLGILISYWGLAAAAIIAKSLGAAVGWGIQFQEPRFVAFLTLLVVLFCLNLWGQFEITLPSSIASIGSGGQQREGLVGHVGSGMFATLMATPCSAPFLGTALGFALSQQAMAIMAIFTAVGIGMAAPYLLIALAPSTVRFLPKPGAWMETVKGAMGFMLFGAAVFLMYVLNAQLSRDGLMWFQFSILLLGLFVFLRSQWEGSRLAHGAVLGVAATFLAGIWIAGSSPAPAKAATTAAADGTEVPWEAFEVDRIAEINASGRAVFVDVTADWCLTCKANETYVLNTPEIIQVFEEHDIYPMKADWTNRNREIGDYLEKYGRYAIPFYILYPPEGEPYVFGEALTKGLVREVVQNNATKG